MRQTFDPYTISEEFKKIFSNLANNLAQKLLAAAKNFCNKSVEDYYNDMFNLNPKKLHFQTIQTRYISDLLKNCDINKAAGIDDLSGRFVRDGAEKPLFWSITRIYNLMKTKWQIISMIFFSNIVKNLKILEYQCENDLHSRLSSYPALQAVMKYRNHPSINIIRHFSQRYSSFYFSQVEKNTVLKEIRRLGSKKAAQETDIRVEILKENADFFAERMSSIQ